VSGALTFDANAVPHIEAAAKAMAEAARVGPWDRMSEAPRPGWGEQACRIY
jgi:hypothetical protein